MGLGACFHSGGHPERSGNGGCYEGTLGGCKVLDWLYAEEEMRIGGSGRVKVLWFWQSESIGYWASRCNHSFVDMRTIARDISYDR